MYLSPHFNLTEFLISQTGSRLGIKNEPPSAAIANLKVLCATCLEPIRKHFDKPLVISSGYRCEELNKAIGGSPTSEHRNGNAADFTVPGIPNEDVMEFCIKKVKFDQIVAEFWDKANGGWLHIGLRPKCRKQVLRAYSLNGKTAYTPYKLT